MKKFLIFCFILLSDNSKENIYDLFDRPAIAKEDLYQHNNEISSMLLSILMIRKMYFKKDHQDILDLLSKRGYHSVCLQNKYEIAMSINSEKKIAIIAQPGTRFANFYDYNADIKLLTNKIRNKTFNTKQDRIFSYRKKLLIRYVNYMKAHYPETYQDYTYIVTGDSLGGMTAIELHKDLKCKYGLNKVCSMTFDSPGYQGVLDIPSEIERYNLDICLYENAVNTSLGKVENRIILNTDKRSAMYRLRRHRVHYFNEEFIEEMKITD